jgi:hypothetical protein
LGILVSLAGVALVAGLIYALGEVMPVEATAVVYLLPVLLASSYWGAVARRGDLDPERPGVCLLPSSAP